MDFRYAVLPAQPDDAFPTRTSIKRPLVKVSLSHEGRSVTTFAIIDSGADFCLFPANLAHELGIPIPNSRATSFSGTAGSTQLAFFATVQATIWNDDSLQDPISFDLYAGFCETLEHLGQGLLGQHGFLSQFEITFMHAQNVVRVR